MSFELDGVTYELDFTELLGDICGLKGFKRKIEKRIEAGGLNLYDPYEEDNRKETLRNIIYLINEVKRR